MESNNTLQEAVTSLINTSLQAFEKGTFFLQEEIPQVVQQLLLWEAVQSFLVFISGLILICLLIYFNYKQYKFWNKDVEKVYGCGKVKMIETDAGVFALCNLFQIIPLFVVADLITNITWLKIWIAPKLFLIEYAAKLIK